MLPAVAAPDETALRGWICAPAMRSADGRVLSWLNDENPGYPYDEARLHEWMGHTDRAAELRAVVDARVRRWGLLGRDAIGFVFDTALALPLLSEPEPVASRLADMLGTHRVVDRVTRPGWWSQSYGAHQIKALSMLAGFGRRALAEELAHQLTALCFDGRRFHIHPDSGATYVHSHCYALEGLIRLSLHPGPVGAGADWLAEIQLPDGALPAWAGEHQQEQRNPADVVAQAVRIWAVQDASRYAENIRLGLARLAALQAPSGGIAYTAGSADLNSWVAVFTLQALRWAEFPPSALEREQLI